MNKLKKYLRSKLIWSRAKQEKHVNNRRYPAFKFKKEDKMMLNARFIHIMRFNKFLNHKNLNSFRIIEIINNSAYKLNLFESINKLFSVFHSWLLHLNKANSLSDQINSNSSFTIIADKKK